MSKKVNNYSIDMKFYNTYGQANIYYTLDSNGTNKKVLDRVKEFFYS